MTKAVFFDLDGTLLDSRHRIHRLFCDLAGSDALGFDEYWRLKRAGARQEELLAQHFGLDAAAAAAFRRRWLEQIEAPERLLEDRPCEGATGLLAQLAPSHALFIVTGRQDAAPVQAQAQRFGWTPHLRGVLATGLSRKKEDLIREAWTCTPADAFVGDSGEDLLAGKALGIRAIAVGSGFNEPARLQAYGPELLVDDLAGVARALGLP